MTIDTVWHILGKKLSGSASEEELAELDSLLRRHPELYYPVQNIMDLWDVHSPEETIEARQALRQHLLRLQASDDSVAAEAGAAFYFPKRKRKGMIAAILLLSVGLSVLYLWISRSAVIQQSTVKKNRNEVSTKQGSHSKVVLPDGSVVWLNAKSSIIYNKDFEGEIREVTLDGEAYFDVAHDSSRPFIIHASNIDIRVLGTVFNVKSYGNDGYTETSLIEGEIEVSLAGNPGKRIRMKPSEKLVVRDSLPNDTPDRRSNQQTIIRTTINYEPADSTITETLWMDNRLVFRDRSFADLAVEFERRYGVIFEFTDEAVKTLAFTAAFKNESAQQALEALQLANHFNYYISNDTIFINR